MKDDLFRLSLILQDESISNLEKYIFEYVKIALFYINKSSKAIDICKYIETSYDISFTEVEVNDILDKHYKKGDLVKDNESFYLPNKSVISIQKRISDIKTIDYFVNEYVENQNIHISKSDILPVINRFVYYCFEKYKRNIIDMLGNGKVDVSQLKMGDFDATLVEKELVNSFLEWDNDEKNKTLFKVINAGFNYGMITVKKWINSHAFSGKFFYLDTNVIIPLSGIGNPSRVHAMHKFEQKSRELSIVFCYSTTTSNEINELLVKKCSELNRLVQKIGVVKPSALTVFGTGGLEDFYCEYFEWQKTNDYRDFTAFHKYLYSKVQNTLLTLKMVSIDELDIKKDKNYTFYTEELHKRKEERRGYASINTAEIDVVNYLYLSRLSLSNKKNVWDNNHYIISLDRVFCLWADERKKDFISNVTHPVIWLGLFMKFTGRVNDDLAAFTKFLQLPIEEHKKVDINLVIDEMDDISSDDKVRSRLITELSYMLEDFPEIEDINVKQMTRKAHELLIEEKENQIKEKYEQDMKNIEERVEERQKNKLRGKIRDIASTKAEKKLLKWKFYYKHKTFIMHAMSVVFTIILLGLLIITPWVKNIRDFINQFNEDSDLISEHFITGVISILSYLLSYIILFLIDKRLNSYEDVKSSLHNRELKNQEKLHEHLFID